MEFGRETIAGLNKDLYFGIVANSMVYFATRTGKFDHVWIGKE